MATQVKQNSTAVVARRLPKTQTEADYYPTPPWGTQALLNWMSKKGISLAGTKVWEPACGGGHMSEVLQSAGATVYESDLFDHEARGIDIVDFRWPEPKREFDWIITNPPFNQALDFALTALHGQRPRLGVCLLARIQLLEGKERYDRLHQITPPNFVLPFVYRISMVKGRIDSKVSSASCYAWFVWVFNRIGPKPLIEWLTDKKEFKI